MTSPPDEVGPSAVLSVAVQFLGNAGVCLRRGEARAYVDSFFYPAPHVGTPPVLKGRDAQKADVILVTHIHADHFLGAEIAAAAQASGAVVVGPAVVTERMARHLPADRLAALEPPEGAKPYASVRRSFGAFAVTAFRTRHGGGGHNSYLLETGGWRFYHDGDNESARFCDRTALASLDALFLCPWQGSGALDLVRAIRPRQWFLIHLTGEELAQHEAGEFMPGMFPGETALPEAAAVRPGGEYQWPTALSAGEPEMLAGGKAPGGDA